MNSIKQRYDAVRARASAAAEAVGRVPADVTVVAVTKHVGIPEVQAALDAGCIDFGENRVQDFLGKYDAFPDARWHFIGTLQTNKVKDVVGSAYLIHSVDSVRLLRKIEAIASAKDVEQRVLLQFNVSGEESKHGMVVDDAADILREAAGMSSVKVVGLMTIAPFDKPESVRWVFRSLAELFATSNAMRFNGMELRELSMGMTNDYCIAVEEGATIIRVGTGIFGR